MFHCSCLQTQPYIRSKYKALQNIITFNQGFYQGENKYQYMAAPSILYISLLVVSSVLIDLNVEYTKHSPKQRRLGENSLSFLHANPKPYQQRKGEPISQIFSAYTEFYNRI